MKSTSRMVKALLGLGNLLLGFALTGQALAQGGTWVTKAPMPTPRLAAAAVSINGIIYAVGGGNYSCGTYSTVEAYNPATNIWITKASMPTPRYGLAVAAVNGILYAIGGGGYCNNAYNRATVEAYDPATDLWTTKASMPIALRYLTAGVIDGIIYVVGGGGDTFNSQTAYAYNPATDTWTAKAAATPLRTGSASGVVNGILYWVGGYDSSLIGPADAYNPVSDTWARTASSMLEPRSAVGAGVVNGTLYVITGSNAVDATRAVESYNPMADQWTSLAPIPTARLWPAVAVANGVIYTLGGYTNNGATLADNEAYAPATPADTTAPVLALPAGITTNATSPAGAIVSYTATATDDSGASPTVACAPAPGSTFPIGTTTVNCTASDAAGNSSSGSFAVTVNGPTAQTLSLMELVQSLNLGGTGNSLNSKLQNATSPFATNTCNQFNAFINEARAQSGKKLTAAEASQLIAGANQVRAAAGCP